MHESLRNLDFPVIAFSRAGWDKAASDIYELTETADEKELPDFLDLKICDSAGRAYVVERVWRGWPKSKVGALLCRFTNNCIYADFEISEPAHLPLEELKQRVRIHYPKWDFLYEARTHRELIDMLL